MNLYEDLFHVTENEDSDLADILTNMLACASNTQDQQQVNAVENLVGKAGGKIEKTYEFFFNLAQLQMKQQLQEDAFRSLVNAYSIARNEDEGLHSELGRFKVQELHVLNSFSHEFSSIEYNVGGSLSGARFNLPKTLKHDNLVELNMSALSQEESAFGAGIDRNHFKEIFGNLNWNKFAERISQ